MPNFREINSALGKEYLSMNISAFSDLSIDISAFQRFGTAKERDIDIPLIFKAKND